jgi:hypothetical protein
MAVEESFGTCDKMEEMVDKRSVKRFKTKTIWGVLDN